MAVISYEITGIRPLASYEIGTIVHKINYCGFGFKRELLFLQQPADVLLKVPEKI